MLLTIPLVMIACLLIYVPAIANFWMNRLNDRLAAANTAALVLDAAPSGMVPDSLARQILTSIGARAVAIKMGQQRRLLASADLPSSIDHDIDSAFAHGVGRDHRFLPDDAGDREPGDSHYRSGAGRRAIHRSRGR